MPAIGLHGIISTMKTVIICSPIKRKPAILSEFLKGLDRLDTTGINIQYYFTDDNDDPASSKLLQDFQASHKKVHLRPASEIVGPSLDFNTSKSGLHTWSQDLMNRVAAIKDDMLDYAQEINADYAFLVDSDIIMSPKTIKHLIERKVDIVSEIFWTEWIPGQLYSPNAWLQDEISPFVNFEQKHYDEWQIKQFTASFYNMLKIPGIYEVGGLGACTLISNHAITTGARFKLVDNVSFSGEDRHFCIRARALDLLLHIDTVYPAYHIYRDDLLAGVNDFIKNGFSLNRTFYNTGTGSQKLSRKILSRLSRTFKKCTHGIISGLKNFARWSWHLLTDIRRIRFSKKRIVRTKPKLTLSMTLHNESGRFLEQVFESVLPFIDEAVIIDDASTDDTVEICKKYLKNVKHKIIRNQKSKFANESQLRKQQWDATVKTHPDWILILDADEIPEKRFAAVIPELMQNADVDIYNFYPYDFWKDGYYREDALWYGHKTGKPYMIRYQPHLHYKFPRRKQHSGHIPYNAFRLMTECNYPLRVKHMGWLRDEDKKAKYNRYMQLDPNGEFGSLAQYKSILDDAPPLKEFLED